MDELVRATSVRTWPADNVDVSAEHERRGHSMTRRAYGFAVALALAVASLTWLLSYRYNLPLRDPDGLAGPSYIRLPLVVLLFYIADVVPRALIANRGFKNFTESVKSYSRERWTRSRWSLVLVGLFTFYIVYVGYRNLKGFLPAIRYRVKYDTVLLKLDRAFAFGHDPATVLHHVLGIGIAAQVLALVYVFFLDLRATQSRGGAGVVQERGHRFLVCHRLVHQLGTRRRQLLLGAVGRPVHLQREGFRDPPAHGGDEPAGGIAPGTRQLPRGPARNRLGARRRRLRVPARLRDLHRLVDLLVRDTEPPGPGHDVGLLRAHRRSRPSTSAGTTSWTTSPVLRSACSASGSVRRQPDIRWPSSDTWVRPATESSASSRRSRRRLQAVAAVEHQGQPPDNDGVGEETAPEGSTKDTAPA